MENASKALIIAGAILISILIIAIGMGIYNKAKTAVDNAGSGMETTQIEAFNAEWLNYEGVQTGTQVKAMINKLIAHANIYQEEAGKVIGLNCQAKSADDTSGEEIIYEEGALEDFVSNLNNTYTSVKPKHKYYVTIEYSASSLIRKINVAYEIPSAD